MDSARHVKRISLGQSALLKKPSAYPRKLDIELTRRCNNNCVHCLINLPANDKKALQDELSTDEIKNYIKQMTNLGCIMVRFTGGEPMLRSDFEEIYCFARKLGLQVSIFTNATCITPQLASLLREIPPLKEIDVTLYGMSRSTYEKVSQVAGTFEKAWRGIELLNQYNIPFFVRTVELPQNSKDKQRFKKWASTLPWQNLSPSIVSTFNLRCLRDSKEKNKRIRSLRPSPEELAGRLISSQEFVDNEITPYCKRQLNIAGNILLNCAAAVNDGCISAEGILYPCYSLRHPVMAYDLRKGNLQQAFEHFFPALRKMVATNSDYLNRCARCFLKNLCQQCPAISNMETGTLDTPAGYYCQATHIIAARTGLLKPGEKSWEVENWRERLQKLGKKR